jgi:SAM-dependent methyltransferase
MLVEQGGNGVLQANPIHCGHISFGKCGECKAAEPKPPTVEQLLARIAALEERSAKNVEATRAAVEAAEATRRTGPLKLDLGCGNSTRRTSTKLTKALGWTGVDFPGVEGIDVGCNLAAEVWPWPDNSVDEVNCAHMVEHIPAKQRVHFFNELWRVLKPGARAQVITPHWASCRAYGDITHEWPPVSEMFWGYLNKQWRAENAPHCPFSCDFDFAYGYATAEWLQGRNPEFVQNAIQKYKEAAQDMGCTLTKRA